MNRLRVLTRNLYLGADIERLVAALGDPEEVGRAMLQVRDVVAATDFGVRARGLAAEIVAAAPDVLGLQEVALWRERGATGEQVVSWDFLALLLAELDRLADSAGLADAPRYRVAICSDRADLAVPIFVTPTSDPGRPAEVRLTMRDAMLVRAQVPVLDSGAARYRANLSVQVAGLDLAPERGFQWVEVALAGRPVRVVNTHLESLGADLTLAQAEELVSAVPGDRPVVILGDFNSDPLDDVVRDGAQAAPSAAYRTMLAAGFRDAWAESADPAAGPGWTACLGELLADPGDGFDHRLDFVFVRGYGDWSPRLGEVGVTGTRPLDGGDGDDADATGRPGVRWASDHAGVFATIHQPAALPTA